jgi:hypothetical protein
VGVICGMLALAPIPLLHLLRPKQDDNVIISGLVPWTAAVGAGLGAVLGPVLAWSLLRPVPLWRMVLQPALGAVIGSLVGLGVVLVWMPRGIAIPGCGFAGTIVAGFLLRGRKSERPRA